MSHKKIFYVIIFVLKKCHTKINFLDLEKSVTFFLPKNFKLEKCHTRYFCVISHGLRGNDNIHTFFCDISKIWDFFGRIMSQTFSSLGSLFLCDIFSRRKLSRKMFFVWHFARRKKFLEREMSQIFQTREYYFCVTIFRTGKCHIKIFAWHFSNLESV